VLVPAYVRARRGLDRREPVVDVAPPVVLAEPTSQECAQR